MSEYKITIFPYEYALIESEKTNLKLEFGTTWEELEKILQKHFPEHEFKILDHPPDADDFYLVYQKNDHSMFKMRFEKRDYKLVEMVFLPFGTNKMDIYYNGVQLYDRLFKDVMRDLEPFNLEYYVSEPFMYLTSSGVLIYISNQYSTLEKPDPDWNSIEWLLHCPVEGAAIDSGFLNTQNPSPDWWYLFDTSKETWYDCEPAKKKKDDDR